MTYDIHIQPVAADQVYGKKCYEFGFSAALKIDGFQALISRWAKTLLTPRGSDPLDKESGTTLTNLLGANVASVANGVRDFVALAVEDANEQVREQDLVGFRPDNERLQSGELIDFRESPGGIELWVRLTNIAGEGATFRVVNF